MTTDPQPTQPTACPAVEGDAQLLELLASQQAALRESESRYRTLVEWAPQAVAVHRNGKLLYVNPAAIALLHGCTASDIVGKHIGDFLHRDDRQLALERARMAMVQGISLQLHVEKLKRLDGTIALVEIQSTSIHYDGEPAVYVVAHDLSERQEDKKPSITWRFTTT